ncbi:MAG: pilus assembly FimT family protein [Solidesulfovibrio sp. DCME]|uniref:pilus assembly FimT family protein n=1 Tax=Solidesulfovibrio sp. DCME TaxID=3447380 RepID=UPI003D11E025
MADSPRQAFCGPAGFTLVELTIALVVMGIAAGLALPMLSAMLPREGQKTTARVIQGVLRRTQAEALLAGHDWRVDIDWAKGQCRAAQVDQTVPPPSNAVEKTPSAPLAKAPAVKDGRGVTVSAALPAAQRPLLTVTTAGLTRRPDVTSLVLRPQGLCQPAFVRLADADGKSAALVISAVGCRVELLQSDLEAAQERFEQTHGQPRLPWDAAATAGGKG